jgi:hypothetical protein
MNRKVRNGHQPGNGDLVEATITPDAPAIAAIIPTYTEIRILRDILVGTEIPVSSRDTYDQTVLSPPPIKRAKKAPILAIKLPFNMSVTSLRD